MAPRGSLGAQAERRKSAGTSTQSTLVITLTLSPARLRAIIDGEPEPELDAVKEETPIKESKESPAPSNSDPNLAPASSNSNNENASDSNPNTPGPGTPAPQTAAMGPPTEGPKKKGVKRAAGAANGNGEPKVRGKPGPKKKQRLEDGTIDARTNGAAAHKLGPRANQGAINAGLRALDRSGKPCRKWSKGGFTLKTFTGVTWGIERWTAPPRLRPESTTEDSAPASEGSSKENKEASQAKSDNNSNNGGDVEMHSAASVPASSPAPMAIAAA